MLYTPAYIFTLLLGIWVLSLIGCIVLGIACYRLLGERRRLRARLEQLATLPPEVQLSALEANVRSADSTLPHLPTGSGADGEAAPPADK